MFKLPVPASRLPAMQVHNVVMLASLPPRVRELYGLGWTSAHAAAFRAVPPRRARRDRCRRGGCAWGEHTRSFDLVAERERRRIARGLPIAGAL